MFKNKSILWWILIGWWLAIIYFSIIGWWLIPLRIILENIKPIKPFYIDVVGTYYYKDNISQWLLENSYIQWQDQNYTKKSIFKFPVVDTDRVFILPEPDNIHDRNAVVVYLDSYKIGYISSQENIEFKKIMKKNPSYIAKITGGDFKYKDEFGDIIKQESNYRINILVYKKDI